MKKLFAKLFPPKYVVRGQCDPYDPAMVYLIDRQLQPQLGFNVEHVLTRKTERFTNLNRARKIGKLWWGIGTFEIRQVHLFGLFTTLVERHVKYEPSH